MPLVSPPAVVLQTYRYSETSKVVRLATRELGGQSAIAKVAMRPKSPFGAGLGLFGEGGGPLAEALLKMAPAAPLPAAYDTFTAGLDALAAAPAEQLDAAATRAIW